MTDPVRGEELRLARAGRALKTKVRVHAGEAAARRIVLITRAAIESGLNQEQVAEALGIESSVLSRLMTGQRKSVGRTVADRVSRVVGLDISNGAAPLIAPGRASSRHEPARRLRKKR